jgi:para-nitrobenzyl esterase
MNESPVVLTGSGRVQGIHQGETMSFRSIPFAEPPVNELRFRSASRHRGWTGILDTTRPGPGAVQAPSRLNGVMGDPPVHLDEAGCLVLNVWTTDLNGSAPVLFWLHGGAFMSGSASWPWYDASRLVAEQGIVVVTANYRLGAFGFLYLSELVGSSHDFGLGNAGYSDQRMALNWVVENVAAFGGDPDNITVGGQSAGAQSAIRLARHSDTKDHVKRLIAQSAVAGASDQSVAEATEWAGRFLHELGIDPKKPDRLRHAPSSEVLDAFVRLQQEGGPASSVPMRPVAIDLGEQTLNPACELTEGIATNIPVLAGTTRNEMAAFLRQGPGLADADEQLAEFVLSHQFGDAGPNLFGTYRSNDPIAPPGVLLESIMGDGMFLVPLLESAEGRSSAGRTTYVYRFDWSNSHFDSCHCIELPFLFGNFDMWPAAPMLGDASTDSVSQLSRALRDTWGTFVRDGRPGLVNQKEWTAYDLDRRATMRFDVESELVDDLSAPARKAFAQAGVPRAAP